MSLFLEQRPVKVKSLILQDINQSKKDSIDKLIVFIHLNINSSIH